MEVKYLSSGDYYVQEKINGQTYYMAFQKDIDQYPDIIAYNVYFCIYSKRKHESLYNQEITSTGKNPFATYRFAKSAFHLLEQEVITNSRYQRIKIFCTWLDARRRDAYYHYLHRFGYEYATHEGKKCIAKIFTNMPPESEN